MAQIIVYIGIGIAVVGWLLLAWFAAGQIKAQKDYALAPHKWEDIKRGYVNRRWMSRGVILIGIILIIVSILI